MKPVSPAGAEWRAVSQGRGREPYPSGAEEGVGGVKWSRCWSQVSQDTLAGEDEDRVGAASGPGEGLRCWSEARRNYGGPSKGSRT